MASVALLGLELYVGLMAFRAGNRLAQWFLIATGILASGLWLASLIFAGVLQVSLVFSRIMILIGIAGELFGLAYALAESIREVTAEKEQALRRVEVERLGALHGLVAGVAHELNTPLGALRSSVDSMKRAADKLTSVPTEDAGARRAVKALPSVTDATIVATERIDQVVRSLKLFAQLDESEVQTCDLHEGLESALTLLAPKLGTRIRVERQYDGPTAVSCRAGAINQVFMSILDNAVAAIEGEGTIRVATKAGLGQMSVQISDTGIGMSAAQLGTLFSPRLSLRGERAKMGMGLSTARSIVDQHGGRIDVQSEPGRGTDGNGRASGEPDEVNEAQGAWRRMRSSRWAAYVLVSSVFPTRSDDYPPDFPTERRRSDGQSANRSRAAAG